MALETASDPISWRQAAAWIRDGSTTQLAKLQRSEQELRKYRAFKEQVLLEWSSLLDYLIHQIFECTITLNKEDKKCAEVSSHILQQAEPVMRWRENDFPYNFEAGISHHVLWSSKPLDEQAIQSFLDIQLPDQEVLFWINPQELQSVRAVSESLRGSRSGVTPVRQGALF